MDWLIEHWRGEKMGGMQRPLMKRIWDVKIWEPPEKMQFWKWVRLVLEEFTLAADSPVNWKHS